MDNTEETPKAQFTIDFFQTARVHTERVVQEFETEEEARNYAKDLCKDKGIDEDFEIQDTTPVVESVVEDGTTTTDSGVDAAPATEE